MEMFYILDLGTRVDVSTHFVDGYDVIATTTNIYHAASIVRALNSDPKGFYYTGDGIDLRNFEFEE